VNHDGAVVKLRCVAALLFIAIGANADPQAVQPSLVYDGAAFDDIAGLRRGSTYLGSFVFN
jgi:hypothetical protein